MVDEVTLWLTVSRNEDVSVCAWLRLLVLLRVGDNDHNAEWLMVIEDDGTTLSDNDHDTILVSDEELDKDSVRVREALCDTDNEILRLNVGDVVPLRLP